MLPKDDIVLGVVIDVMGGEDPAAVVTGLLVIGGTVEEGAVDTRAVAVPVETDCAVDAAAVTLVDAITLLELWTVLAPEVEILAVVIVVALCVLELGFTDVGEVVAGVGVETFVIAVPVDVGGGELEREVGPVGGGGLCGVVGALGGGGGGLEGGVIAGVDGDGGGGGGGTEADVIVGADGDGGEDAEPDGGTLVEANDEPTLDELDRPVDVLPTL